MIVVLKLLALCIPGMSVMVGIYLLNTAGLLSLKWAMVGNCATMVITYSLVVVVGLQMAKGKFDEELYLRKRSQLLGIWIGLTLALSLLACSWVMQ